MELSVNLEYFIKPNNGGGCPGFVNTVPIVEFAAANGMKFAFKAGNYLLRL